MASFFARAVFHSRKPSLDNAIRAQKVCKTKPNVGCSENWILDRQGPGFWVAKALVSTLTINQGVTVITVFPCESIILRPRAACADYSNTSN